MDKLKIINEIPGTQFGPYEKRLTGVGPVQRLTQRLRKGSPISGEQAEDGVTHLPKVSPSTVVLRPYYPLGHPRRQVRFGV